MEKILKFLYVETKNSEMKFSDEIILYYFVKTDFLTGVNNFTILFVIEIVFVIKRVRYKEYSL